MLFFSEDFEKKFKRYFCHLIVLMKYKTDIYFETFYNLKVYRK